MLYLWKVEGYECYICGWLKATNVIFVAGGRLRMLSLW